MMDRVRLSRDALKLVACVSMLLDHVACAFVPPGTAAYMAMRLVVGRMAYPIFCVLFVEGIGRTKRPWRHVCDLALFAVLSESFFDRALQGRWIDLDGQNVYLSWLIGAIMILAMSWLDRASSRGLDGASRVLGKACALVLGCVAAVFLGADYSFVGIVCMFLTRLAFSAGRPAWQAAFAVGAVLCVAGTPGVLLAVPLFAAYDPGMPRRGGAVAKYASYGFYPVHLAVLAAIRCMLAI